MYVGYKMVIKIKSLIKNILLIFVFISIGFILGKYSMVMTDDSAVSSQTLLTDLDKKTQNVVHVYYMHSTFRCITCNTIEKTTKQLLYTQYSKDLKEGEIIFSEVDFQTNIKLSKKFHIVSGCVVVAKERDGKIIDFKRLDEVWTLWDKPKAFNSYISKAINSFLFENNKKGDVN